MKELCKALDCEREVTLSKDEADRLKAYIAGLEQDSECAAAYRDELLGKLKKTLREKGVSLDYQVEECIINKLSISEAQAVYRALTKKARQAVPQLRPDSSEKTAANTEFRI